jgi:SAM-dependent methyltransferase
MNIQLITMWYNEEFLAPFFLNHYSWVDKIHIVLDADTNDRTEEIVREYPNVEIEYFKFPDMMDDILKVSKLNSKYSEITDADYVILVDSDEFIFCYDLKKSVRTHLENTNKNVYFVNLWQIFKHEADGPLDPNVSIPLQRMHGDPDMDDPFNILYIKPSIVRGNKDLFWTAGNHEVVYEGNRVLWRTRNPDTMKALNMSLCRSDMLQGSHWRLVDLEETIKRRITNRKLRQSQVNLSKGLTEQYHNISEQDIMDEYERNKCLPVVITSISEAGADSELESGVGVSMPPPATCDSQQTPQLGKKKSLDLGCGQNPQNPFYADEVFGVDIRDDLGANILCADLSISPIPYGDESFDFVSANDFLEHIPRVIYAPARRNCFVELMDEIYRVLKTGGLFLSFTPAYPHPAAFQDPTHVNIITEDTFRLYFDNVNRWAAQYGFKGAFAVRMQEWRGMYLLTVLQKVPIQLC